LNFLGLPGNTGYSEAAIEQAIINHLQQFILELGKGFAFVERQQLVRRETSDYYDELKRNEGDNPTIDILLCADTDADIARYSILKGNEHLFATKYKLYLPTEAQLRKEIEREKEFIRLQLEDKE
jgi:hypothetical protein